MMSSGSQMLLKYKYTKKPAGEKLPRRTEKPSRSGTDGVLPSSRHSSCADSESSTDIAGAGSVGLDSDVDIIPETPPPQVSHKAECDETFEIESKASDTVSPKVSSLASPWLSKARGKILNSELIKSTGAVKKRHDDDWLDSSEETSSSASTDSQATNSGGSAKLEMAELNTLYLLHPEKSQDELKLLLKSCGNLENALKALTGNSKGVKRRRIVSQKSSESEWYTPLKRVKQIVIDTDSSDSDAEADLPHLDAKTKKNRASLLQEAFPDFSVEELHDLLEENNWSIEATTDWLSCDQKQGVKKSSVNISDLVGDVITNYSSDGESADESEDYDELNQTDVESERTIIFSFFEESCLEELISVPGCSRKKAALILSLRPFKTWDNLVGTLEKTKGLSYSLISGGKEVIHIREVVRQLMNKCEKMSREMESLVSYLTSTTEVEQQQIQIKKQPKILNENLQLKAYQIIGVNWLRILHSQKVNGILADEMGLGKTIQAISFLAHLLEEGEEGPHLIIVPSSTIDNWHKELQLWCPALKVVIYFGSQEERAAMRHSLCCGTEVHIILTTYNMATGTADDRYLLKKMGFHYAIFDEGHMLKNMSSLRYKTLMKIQAERRLLLTGTPLQNNLLELMSLLSFVMPHLFVGKTEYLKKTFSIVTKASSTDGSRNTHEAERIAHAKRIMKPFVLRRLKSDVLKQMPKKEERIIHCSMIPEQQELYNSLVQIFSTEMSELESSASNNMHRQNMFMQLRKAANHPLLQRRHYNDEKLREMSKLIAKEPSHKARQALPDLIFEDLSVMSDFEIYKLCKFYKHHIGDFALEKSLILDSGKFRILDGLLSEMNEKKDRVLLFSQFTMMMDIFEEYLKDKNYKYLRLDGMTPVQERQKMIDSFNTDESWFIFMLSTKAGGLGINLTSANVVILHDIDFNPYNDKQAEDRCHRLGQKRKVHILRLISKNSVEEAMFRCAQDKLKLEKDMTNYDQNKENLDVVSLLKEGLKQTNN